MVESSTHRGCMIINWNSPLFQIRICTSQWVCSIDKWLGLNRLYEMTFCFIYMLSWVLSLYVSLSFYCQQAPIDESMDTSQTLDQGEGVAVQSSDDQANVEERSGFKSQHLWCNIITMSGLFSTLNWLTIL